jgi:hypothetical protein
MLSNSPGVFIGRQGEAAARKQEGRNNKIKVQVHSGKLPAHYRFMFTMVEVVFYFPVFALLQVQP